EGLAALGGGRLEGAQSGEAEAGFDVVRGEESHQFDGGARRPELLHRRPEDRFLRRCSGDQKYLRHTERSSTSWVPGAAACAPGSSGAPVTRSMSRRTAGPSWAARAYWAACARAAARSSSVASTASFA